MTASNLFQSVRCVFLRARRDRRWHRRRGKDWATRRMHVEALDDRRLLSIGPWDEDVSAPAESLYSDSPARGCASRVVFGSAAILGSV